MTVVGWLLSPQGRVLATAAALIGLLGAVAFLGARWQAARDQLAAVRAERDVLVEERAATARLLEARAARETELLASLDDIREKADALVAEARQRPSSDRRLVRNRERLLAIRPRGPAGDPAAGGRGGGAVR